MGRPDPNYVLRANEMDWAPVENAKTIWLLKKAVYGLLVAMLFFSLVLRTNFFMELSLLSKVLLFSLCIKVLTTKEVKEVPVPFEIRFYDDYLVLYREKAYYNPKLTRKEIFKFRYQDIKEVEFRTYTQKFLIFGIVEGKYYPYKKDGTLPEKPSYHKVTDSFAYFYTSADPTVDFVAEFERHTPLKVQVKTMD